MAVLVALFLMQVATGLAEGSLPPNGCLDGEYGCDGRCIPERWRCDDERDCEDGSDEHACAQSCNTTKPACSQNCRQTPNGPKCYCNEGFRLASDGIMCEDIDECSVEGVCSQQCTNGIGSYECSCLEGYQLINNKCKASGPEPILVFSTLHEIRAMYLRSRRNFTVHRAVSNAASVDGDPLESRVYWAEISNKSTVYSSKLDGSGFSIVLSNGLMIPEGIAVDYVARNLYLTDSSLKQILTCKMDGSMCHALHTTNIDKPRAIEVDLPEGLLYWSDWGENTSGIYRSGMDGSRRTAMVSKDIQWPNGIAVDHASNRLYWSDAKLLTIEYITLDGQYRKALFSKVLAFHPYSLAVFEDNLYWSDWITFTLQSINKFTGHDRVEMAREDGKHIMGVYVYHPVQARRTSNPCSGSSCSHICLIAPQNGFRCACPPGFILEGNLSTCLIDGNYPMLLVNDENQIYHIRPESVGSISISELPLSRVNLIGKLAYDWKSKTLFISDMKSPAIYLVNMTTLSRRELIRDGLVAPESLAFDPRSGNLYWVDSSKGTVEVVATTDPKHSVIVSNLSHPMDIALVPESGIMFVSTIGKSPSVWMFDMDGKNGKVLNADVGIPMAIAVHPSAGLLYWVDSKTTTISSLDYTNSNSQPKVVRSYVENVLSIAVDDKFLYWTDSKHHVVHLLAHDSFLSTISLPGAKSGQVSRKVVYASVPKSRRSSDLDCTNNNGGCSFLCLTSPIGPRCTCPSGEQLSQDGKSCAVCEGYPCPVSGECISWSKVCDGEHDCFDLSDEGLLCASSCDGTCSHKCQKTPQGSKCSCNEGFVLSKDGITCQVANECTTPGRCSHFCNNTKNGPSCSCAEGYVLATDERTCKAVGGDAYLAYLATGGIRGLSLATTYHHRLVYIGRNFESVIGMDYDATDRTFFWADRKEKTVSSFPIESGQFSVLFRTQQEPVFLRRDWMTKNMYYTTGDGSIVCCNGDGRYCTSVVTHVSSRISGFDISPQSAFIFWSVSSLRVHHSGSGLIERANMGGSLRVVIVSENVFLPAAITVDPVLETIYWCDSVLGVIESADFNGLQRRKIVEYLQYPISMAVFEDSIYWSDRATNNLSRCDKFNCEDPVVLLTEASQINFLVIVHEVAKMQGENRCADNNCSHLCLPTRASFVCKCDLSDRTNCERGSLARNQSCPDDYCSQSAECVVEGERYICRCPLQLTGDRCEESLLQTSNSSIEVNPVWFVCAVLIVICLCSLAAVAIFYRRYRRKSAEVYSAVQFVSTGSCQGYCETTDMSGRQENEYQTVLIT